MIGRKKSKNKKLKRKYSNYSVKRSNPLEDSEEDVPTTPKDCLTFDVFQKSKKEILFCRKFMFYFEKKYKKKNQKLPKQFSNSYVKDLFCMLFLVESEGSLSLKFHDTKITNSSYRNKITAKFGEFPILKFGTETHKCLFYFNGSKKEELIINSPFMDFYIHLKAGSHKTFETLILELKNTKIFEPKKEIVSGDSLDDMLDQLDNNSVKFEVITPQSLKKSSQKQFTSAAPDDDDDMSKKVESVSEKVGKIFKKTQFYLISARKWNVDDIYNWCCCIFYQPEGLKIEGEKDFKKLQLAFYLGKLWKWLKNVKYVREMSSLYERFESEVCRKHEDNELIKKGIIKNEDIIPILFEEFRKLKQNFYKFNYIKYKVVKKRVIHKFKQFLANKKDEISFFNLDVHVKWVEERKYLYVKEYCKNLLLFFMTTKKKDIGTFIKEVNDDYVILKYISGEIFDNFKDKENVKRDDISSITMPSIEKLFENKSNEMKKDILSAFCKFGTKKNKFLSSEDEKFKKIFGVDLAHRVFDKIFHYPVREISRKAYVDYKKNKILKEMFKIGKRIQQKNESVNQLKKALMTKGITEEKCKEILDNVGNESLEKKKMEASQKERSALLKNTEDIFYEFMDKDVFFKGLKKVNDVILSKLEKNMFKVKLILAKPIGDVGPGKFKRKLVQVFDYIFRPGFFSFGYFHASIIVKNCKIQWFNHSFVDIGEIKTEDNYEELCCVEPNSSIECLDGSHLEKTIERLANIIVNWNVNYSYTPYKFFLNNSHKNCHEFAIDVLRKMDLYDFADTVLDYFSLLKSKDGFHYCTLSYTLDFADDFEDQLETYKVKYNLVNIEKRKITFTTCEGINEFLNDILENGGEEEHPKEISWLRSNLKKFRKKEHQMELVVNNIFKNNFSEAFRVKGLVVIKNSVFFDSHQILDMFCSLLFKKMGEKDGEMKFSQKYPGIFLLLKSFDTAFHLRYRKAKNSKANRNLKNLKSEICPFVLRKEKKEKKEILVVENKTEKPKESIIIEEKSMKKGEEEEEEEEKRGSKADLVRRIGDVTTVILFPLPVVIEYYIGGSCFKVENENVDFKKLRIFLKAKNFEKSKKSTKEEIIFNLCISEF